jgi:hypothetical protein
MVEITDEMVQAYNAAWDHWIDNPPEDDVPFTAERAGLAAVAPLIAAQVQAQLTALAPCGNGCVLAAVALSEQVWTGEVQRRG